MKKVFVVSGAMSGEDFEADHPEIFGIFETLESAKKCFEEAVEEYKPDESVECEFNKTDMFCDITDFEGDNHICIEIVEKEIKK